jgi:hypothetical protein
MMPRVFGVASPHGRPKEGEPLPASSEGCVADFRRDAEMPPA